jgi:hypothetical protein
LPVLYRPESVSRPVEDGPTSAATQRDRHLDNDTREDRQIPPGSRWGLRRRHRPGRTSVTTARTLAKSSVTGGRPARHLEGSRAVNGCGILRQLSSPARRKSDAVATRDWNLTWAILRARQRTGPRVRRPPLAVTAYLLRRSAAAAGRPDRMQACHHLVPGAGRDFSSFPRGA